MSTKDESKAEGAANPKDESKAEADKSPEKADESKAEEKSGKINVITGDDDFKYQIFMGQRGELLSEVLMFYDDSDMQDSMNKTMKTLKHIFDPSLEGAKPFEDNPSKSKKNNTLIRSRDDVINLYNKYNEKLLELEEKKKSMNDEIKAAKAQAAAATSSGNEAVAAAARDVAGEIEQENKDCTKEIAATEKLLENANKTIKENEAFNNKLIEQINNLGNQFNINVSGNTKEELNSKITEITNKITDLKQKKAVVASQSKTVEELLKAQTTIINEMKQKMTQ